LSLCAFIEWERVLGSRPDMKVFWVMITATLLFLLESYVFVHRVECVDLISIHVIFPRYS
jgi:hypothetical protein